MASLKSFSIWWEDYSIFNCTQQKPFKIKYRNSEARHLQQDNKKLIGQWKRWALLPRAFRSQSGFEIQIMSGGFLNLNISHNPSRRSKHRLYTTLTLFPFNRLLWGQMLSVRLVLCIHLIELRELSCSQRKLSLFSMDVTIELAYNISLIIYTTM